MKKKDKIRDVIYANDIEINRLHDRLAELRESKKNLKEPDKRYDEAEEADIRQLNHRLGKKTALEWVLFDEIEVM